MKLFVSQIRPTTVLNKIFLNSQWVAVHAVCRLRDLTRRVSDDSSVWEDPLVSQHFLCGGAPQLAPTPRLDLAASQGRELTARCALFPCRQERLSAGAVCPMQRFRQPTRPKAQIPSRLLFLPSHHLSCLWTACGKHCPACSPC